MVEAATVNGDKSKKRARIVDIGEKIGGAAKDRIRESVGSLTPQTLDKLPWDRLLAEGVNPNSIVWLRAIACYLKEVAFVGDASAEVDVGLLINHFVGPDAADDFPSPIEVLCRRFGHHQASSPDGTLNRIHDDLPVDVNNVVGELCSPETKRKKDLFVLVEKDIEGLMLNVFWYGICQDLLGPDQDIKRERPALTLRRKADDSATLVWAVDVYLPHFAKDGHLKGLSHLSRLIPEGVLTTSDLTSARSMVVPKIQEYQTAEARRQRAIDKLPKLYLYYTRKNTPDGVVEAFAIGCKYRGRLLLATEPRFPFTGERKGEDASRAAREGYEFVRANRQKIRSEIWELTRPVSIRLGIKEKRLGPQYDLEGGYDDSGEWLRQKFNLRAVEWGNSVTQRERKDLLRELHDGLLDMSKTLGLEPSDMGLNGTLAIAFGSRGKGGKGAPLAHYESSREVINLTREHGAGSLAHEFFHALDYHQNRESPRLNPKDREHPLLTSASSSEMGGIEKRSASCEKVKKRSKPYWDRALEIDARIFEDCILRRLAADKQRNHLLVDRVSKGTFDKAYKNFPSFAKVHEETYPYPIDKEANSYNERVVERLQEYFPHRSIRNDVPDLSQHGEPLSVEELEIATAKWGTELQEEHQDVPSGKSVTESNDPIREIVNGLIPSLNQDDVLHLVGYEAEERLALANQFRSTGITVSDKADSSVTLLLHKDAMQSNGAGLRKVKQTLKDLQNVGDNRDLGKVPARRFKELQLTPHRPIGLSR